MVAYWLPELLKRVWPSRLLGGLGWLLSGLFLCAGVVLLLKPELVDKLGDMDSPVILALSLGVLGLLACWLLRRQPLSAVLTVLTILWLHYGFWSYPLMNHLRTPQQIMQDAGRRLAPQDELLLTNFREQFLLFAERPLYHFAYLQADEPQPKDAAVWLQTSPNRWVLGPGDKLSQCFRTEQGINLGWRHGEEWFLFRADAILPACQNGQSSGAEIFHYTPRLLMGE